MKKDIIKIMTASLLFVLGINAGLASDKENGSGRKIAVQTYTFRNNTLEETFKLLSSVGIKYAECYPEQKLSDKFPEATLMPPLSNEHLEFVKKLMNETGIKIISIGCIMRSPDDAKAFEKQVKDVCDMAQALGAKRVQTEAKYKQIPMWVKYAKERGLTIGVHHHAINAGGNQYYRPEALKDLCDRFEIQSVPDTGHWARSGISPMYGLKMLKGTFPYCIHFKDLNVFGDLNAKVVVFGDGVLDAKAMLSELDSQGFDGYYIIENENIYDNPVPTVKADMEWLKNN